MVDMDKYMDKMVAVVDKDYMDYKDYTGCKGYMDCTDCMD